MPYKDKATQAEYDLTYRQFNKEKLAEQARERMRRMRMLRSEMKRNTLRNTSDETKTGKAEGERAEA